MYLTQLFSLNKEFNVKIKYLHNGKECDRCAYSLGEDIKIVLYIPRLVGASSIQLTYHADNVEGDDTLYFVWCGFEGCYDRYSVTINHEALGVGIYFFKIIVSSQTTSKLYVAESYGTLYTTCDSNCARDFQLTVSDFIYDEVDDYYGGIIYQIFVDRFYYEKRLPLTPGAEYADNWDVIPEYPAYPGAPLKNNKFYGGNLYGIIEKLPYIASLGASLIYLSPIFASPSNHKYDTADYLQVDQMFGGDEALKELIDKASTYGIKIILDGVFNHTGDDSVYFNRYNRYNSLGAYQSATSPYFSWYDFKKHPDQYTCWWGIEILPRINPDVESCRNFFLGENGVIDKYSRLGIAGFRLDVVDELSDHFIKGIKTRMKRSNPSSILYGEVWEDGSNKIAYGTRKQYYLGAELDGVMNYPVRRGIINYLTKKDPAELRYALSEIYNNAPSRIADMQMNLLGSHDTVRILTALADEDVSNLDNNALSTRHLNSDLTSLAVSRLKQAYCILATIPGIPMIFYGDEAGLEGYSDPFNRMPYPWGSENHDLLKFYRNIGNIRRSSASFARGDFEINVLTGDILIYTRTSGDEKYVVVINNSSNNLYVSFNMRAQPILNHTGRAISAGGCEIYRTKSNLMEYNFGN